MPISKENRARYPKDWALRSRFIRFYRAKGKCEYCGAEHGKPHPETGAIVVLTTAHIFDESPESASFFNLKALCQLCHNRLDAPRRRKRRRDKKDEGQLKLWS